MLMIVSVTEIDKRYVLKLVGDLSGASQVKVSLAKIDDAIAQVS
jgi:hypothetical protein